MYRSERGTVHVAEAYYPHLGAHLGHGGKLAGDRISCPFHGWEFDPDGRCGAIHYAKKLPKKSQQPNFLFQFPVHEANGIIWVWFHPDRIEPLFDMEDLGEVLDDSWSEEYERRAWTINVALQEASENAVDNAHFLFVHNAYGMPRPEVSFDGHQRSAVINGGLAGESKDRNFQFTMHTHNDGPGVAFQHFTGSFDSFLFGMVTPITREQMVLRFAFATKQSLSAEERLIVDAYVGEVIKQVEQDIPIWENKRYEPDPTLCDGDGPIAQFRKWFTRFYP